VERILVTGGAGYVGSHIVRELTETGYDVVVIDDLSTGHRAAAGTARLVQSDFADLAVLDRVLGEGVSWIVHMAASCEVGTSMADPAAYYDNNLVRSVRLLEAAVRHGVAGIVFSSSAAVYGEPDVLPIPEEHPLAPTNPYGETKLAFERALHWHARAHGVRWVALRYFNAAGAHPDATIGEDHAPESHLVPRLLRAVLHGSEPIPIFGDDWPTDDGTCVRDYVHVVDLARAHVQALDRMRGGAIGGEAFNLGNGRGFSVRQVIDAVTRVTGSAPPTRTAPRRPGDPAALVASSARAAERLGWAPRFAELDRIVDTAWRWHVAHPRGYEAYVERPGDRD
jgi:UDP-glucose 4-epimerase